MLNPSVVRGAGRWLNLSRAMKIGGFKEPEPLFVAMEAGEFEFNEKLLIRGDIRNERNWYQIDMVSYLYWLGRRNEFSKEEIKAMFRSLGVEIAHVRHKLNLMESRLISKGGTLKRMQKKSIYLAD